VHLALHAGEHSVRTLCANVVAAYPVAHEFLGVGVLGDHFSRRMILTWAGIPIPENNIASILFEGSPLIAGSLICCGSIQGVILHEPNMILTRKASHVNGTSTSKKELCIAAPDIARVVGHGVNNLYE